MFEKEAITSIREITLLLIFIATVVPALVGALIVGCNKKCCCKWVMCMSFILFTTSALWGLLAYGSLIFNLLQDVAYSTEPVRGLVTIQWCAIILAFLSLIWFLGRNID